MSISTKILLCVLILYVSDMETPFLSFSNPNYQPSCIPPSKPSQESDDTENCEPVDINIMSLADEKQEQSKLLNGDVRSNHSEEDDSLSLKSEEPVSDEENDLIDANTKLLNENEDEKLSNTECMNMAYGEKGKGILAYISLLEQSARERSERKRRELLEGGDTPDGGSGDSTPASLHDNIKLKT